MRKDTRNKGYTLVELLVVIALMVILASLAVSVYKGYVERASQVKLVQEARALRQAIVVYEAEKNGGSGSSLNTVFEDLMQYLPSDKKSALYPYVGDSLSDITYCEWTFSRKNKKYLVSGFTFRTDKYEVHYNFSKEPEVTKRDP